MGEAAEAPPRSGWPRLMVELHMSDLDRSLRFWRNLLGFGVAFSRPGFVYLERIEGAQVMLCQRHGRFETGPMETPYGRGALFQVYVHNLAVVADALSARAWPLYGDIREVWRRWGDREGGQRELFVQDPDGYLVMVAEHIGERALPQEDAP
ncbi:VOC family protein [Bauldia sp.]|uniref:VOC family protein n=1 Tax=Bauldia sp. TaxID=2575872 RepID=UPI003BAA2D5C